MPLPDVPFRTLVVSCPSTMKRFSEPLDPSMLMPPPRVSLLVPGAVVTALVKSRPLGIRSMTSFWMLADAAFCFTSMSGDSAVTCTASLTPPIWSAKLTLRICPS